MNRRHAVWLGLAIGLLAGCSEPPYPLPDRNAADVQAEEERLATLLPGTLLSGPGTCDVRLLGREGPSSFAWAHCEAAPGPGVPFGMSIPVRVDGERVTQPGDGSDYSASVRRMFPERLADAVLEDDRRLRP
ncbi:hypothetical protein LUPAC06_06181 [Micromonospora saelicesensis]|uniref:hypothetical protein n=1 Tax=Micromonospora saelicesensis TaxID=285676 RepID=UPI000DC01657|nr:hypothetical protein [Micromonospora saelicesensis]RAO51496.1 hypothetical protein LUPAC06_06181 [Micromonospora saelicesensis]